jgi:preprotein translocase subunit SecY
MLNAFKNTLKIPELKKKLLITFALIAVYRLGSYIPTPGINGKALSQFFDMISRTQGGTIFAIMDLFSGRALSQCTIFALGIMPAISASIIMQLLTVVIPKLERLAKEGGEEGRNTINRYSRYLTIGLGLMQAFFISMWLENPAHFQGATIVDFPGWKFRFLAILTLTSGTAFIMWLAEQITQFGIGNGMSILITAGIISRIPTALRQLLILSSPFNAAKRQIQPFSLLIMLGLMVVVIVAIILITEGQRRIPVQYAKRVIGRKMYGGQNTYIPIRVNHGGVIPIIFAQSVILFPATIAAFIPSPFVQKLSAQFMRGHVLYTVLYAAMIIFFAYFYTAITFNPIDIADNVRKYGGFIPGIRPGKNTAMYLDYILTRIVLPGAIFLAVIAIFPDLVGAWLKVPYLIASFFGGTALLIVVGVMIDTMRQVESFLLMRHYEGFMRHGKLKGRR